MDAEATAPANADATAAARFRRRALWQAVALILLAALPALGSWAWQRHERPTLRLLSPVDAPKQLMPSAVTAAPVLEPSFDNMVNLDQTTAWGDKVLWIDARRRVDFERAHIPGALLLNEDEWNALFPLVLERWSPERQAVVYCDGGACQASRQVAARMRDDGIQGTQTLRGGWPEWVKRFGEPKP